MNSKHRRGLFLPVCTSPPDAAPAEMLKSYKKVSFFQGIEGLEGGALAAGKHLYKFCHRMIFFPSICRMKNVLPLLFWSEHLLSSHRVQVLILCMGTPKRREVHQLLIHGVSGRFGVRRQVS